MSRIVLSLIALIGLTAFAPAPLPRAERRHEGRVDLGWIQGVWQAVSVQEMQPDGKLKRLSWGVRYVHFRGDSWGLDEDPRPNGLRIILDRSRSPVRIDFRDPATTRLSMCGVLKLQGNTLLMLYTFDGPENRPTNFDNMPPGTRLMTLQRER